MSCRLIVSVRAETDLREAFVWYEQRAGGLGHDFLRCVEIKLGLIAQSRQFFRQRSGPHRLAAIARFPYAIRFTTYSDCPMWAEW